jgi:P4 family phage/plasmid primase-like protien
VDGLEGMQEHNWKDYCTKVTAVEPGDKGKALWLDALYKTFLGDLELIDYVQEVVGLAAIGKVYMEAMIIAYGEGRNGKSTFWNTIARVLGGYAGNVSADTLTVGCRRNVKPEMAELKGVRLALAKELEEGMRLNTSVVKQLTSTDDIYGEKKFCKPASFTPSHTLVLYTNHLPRVGASDEGTWRRLIVIPFNAVFEGRSDVKNYADYLFQNAGPAVLAWIIEGAKRIISKDFHLTNPKVVQDAIDAYRGQNDWMGDFLEDCCEVGPTFMEKSGELYQEYRAYCLRMGEYTRSTTDFYGALAQRDFDRKRISSGVVVRGLRIKSEFAG